VTTIVVEHRDHFARFGAEYVEAALAAHGRRLLVVDPSEVHLCAQLYGRRTAHRAARAIATLTGSEGWRSTRPGPHEAGFVGCPRLIGSRSIPLPPKNRGFAPMRERRDSPGTGGWINAGSGTRPKGSGTRPLTFIDSGTKSRSRTQSWPPVNAPALDPGIGRATVLRTVAALKHAGIVEQLSLPGERPGYLCVARQGTITTSSASTAAQCRTCPKKR
jgi:hypothetical protein